MKNLMWLEKGINNHNTMKQVWYLVGVVKLWAWLVVVPKIGFEKLATMLIQKMLCQHIRFYNYSSHSSQCSLEQSCGEEAHADPRGVHALLTSRDQWRSELDPPPPPPPPPPLALEIIKTKASRSTCTPRKH